MAYGEYAMKKSSVLNVIYFSRKGENMCTKTQEVGYHEHKDRYKHGQSTNFGALRSKIMCETSSRRIKYGNMLGPEPRPDKCILHHDRVPVHDTLRVREFLAKKHITKMDHSHYSSDLALEIFRSFEKNKKCPEGKKICWHS
jgi:hypothetical protein